MIDALKLMWGDKVVILSKFLRKTYLMLSGFLQDIRLGAT